MNTDPQKVLACYRWCRGELDDRQVTFETDVLDAVVARCRVEHDLNEDEATQVWNRLDRDCGETKRIALRHKEVIDAGYRHCRAHDIAVSSAIYELMALIQDGTQKVCHEEGR